ncbi:cupin domain-containing protein [Trifolium medium]|uniref:Cupin domain-containing protein n=1 Tax=Trifolium medium TaxID=97028 RepID=A0A392PRS0_9FABA|nr:cupin domain-containing protein [Trifolium medium]
MASSCVGTLSSLNSSLLFSQTKHLSASATPRVSVTLPSTRRRVVRAAVTEKLGIKIERNPPESKLTQLGVRQWPK